MTSPLYAHPLSGVSKVPDGATVVDLIYVDDERAPQDPPSGGGTTVSNATTSTAGIVKMAAKGSLAKANASVATAAAATVTQTEFNDLVNAYNALATNFNLLLDALAASGQLEALA